MIELIEITGIDKPFVRSSDDKFKRRPVNPRANHCTTVEEYRLWRYCSDYSYCSGGYDDVTHQVGISQDYYEGVN